MWAARTPLFVYVGFSFVRVSFFFLLLLFACLICFRSLLVASVVSCLCYSVSVIIVLLRIFFFHLRLLYLRGVGVRVLCGRVVAAVIGSFPVDGVVADASGAVDVVLWVDVEATGVDADCERLLEVAGVVTDMSGRSLGLEPFSRVVDQGSAVEAERVVDGLRGNVAVMHARSGLSEQVRAVGGSGMVAGLVDMEMCAWLEECADAFVGLHGGSSYRVWLGGNSVHADRGFMKRFLPCAYASIDHRVLDASSVARFLRAGGVSVKWVADTPAGHRALPDVLGCVRQYREMLCTVGELGA